MIKTNIFHPLTTILFIQLIAHGLLLLNDGLFWDDYFWYFRYTEMPFDQLYYDDSINGLQLLFYLSWVITRFQYFVFIFRLVTVLSNIFCTMLIYTIAAKSGFVTKQEALWISLFSSVYPAYQASISNVLMTIHLMAFLFFLGVFLTLRCLQTRLYISILTRLLALLCFFISFTLGSFISLYGIFILFLALYLKAKYLLKPILILRFIDFLFLPAFYWLFRRYYLLQGRYSNVGYEPELFSMTTMLQTIMAFIREGIYLQFHFNEAQMLIGLLLTVLFIAIFFARKHGEDDNKHCLPISSYANARQLFVFGLVFFIFSILPYIFTNKPPTAYGLNTRYAFFIGLPVSISLVGFIKIMHLYEAKLVLVTLLLVLFTQKHIENYLNWQARWVKDQSIILNLAKNPIAKASSAILYEDKFYITGTELFYTTDWPGITKLAYGTTDKFSSGFPYSKDKAEFEINIDRVKNDIVARNYYHLFKSFDAEGCRVKVIIFAGDRQESNIGLALRYFYYRFLLPSQLNQFLIPVTYVKVEPYYSDHALNCLYRE